MTGGISPPPCKIPKLDSQSEPPAQVQDQETKLAYLRDTELWDLFPTVTNKRLNAEEGEGSAAPFLREMFKELEKPLLDPQLKEEILVREMRLFLEREGEGHLAKDLDSTGNFKELPAHLRIRFEDKGWHFNASSDVGGHHDYQLLCLGCRGKVDDPVTDFCNKIGNTLQSDLAFISFCKTIFVKLEWDDTEYVGFQRAMEVKISYDKCCPMKSLLIPWVLNVWAAYKTEERKLYDRVELHCRLWNSVVDSKGEFSEALYDKIKHNFDPCTERDFRSVIQYLQQRLSEKDWKKPVFLIDEYFEKSRPVTRLDKGYPRYLKEKITMAIHLGIIKEEDEDKSDDASLVFGKAAEVLREIEDTDLYSWDKLSWFQD